MKCVIALIVAVSLFAPLCASPVDRTALSLVRIEHRMVNEDGSESNYFCTGFLVREHVALTARHCVDLKEQMLVDGDRSSILRTDTEFALLSVPLSDKPLLLIRGRAVEPPEPVWGWGWGWNRLHVFSRSVAALREGDLVTDGPWAPGMSGGPLVDRGGEVVGLIQGSNEMVGIACGAREIQDFLR